MTAKARYKYRCPGGRESARISLKGGDGMADTYAGMKIGIDVDSKEVQEVVNRMREVMEPLQFSRAMYGVMQRTSRHVAKVLGDDVPKKYKVKSAEVKKSVGPPKLSMGVAGGVGCVIPLRDIRRKVGPAGKGSFTASGGRKGWNTVTRKRKKAKKPYKITANILAQAASTLPANMPKAYYGGYPPFRNLSAGGEMKKIVYTRVSKKRLPIKKVIAMSIPQMPMNRSEAEVQKDIADYLQQRVEARLRALIANGR